MTQRWIATDFGGLENFTMIEDVLRAPNTGEVTITVRAAGMNPADYRYVAVGTNRDLLPMPIGYEIAGIISAVGPADESGRATEIASGGGAIGDAVLAFRVSGGYASEITVAAKDVFTKPASLSFPEAANLLLAGTTAAEMLAVTRVGAGDTILLHGASGAVGVSVLQQAATLGVRVIGTASEKNFDQVRMFGGEPIAYGPGLTGRVRTAAPEGITAALDAVGTDEAIDASLELVADRGLIVSIAAFARAAEGYQLIAGSMPASASFRDNIRAELIRRAGEGSLVVPMARTFALADAAAALQLLSGEHPGGKIALIPGD
ncbi:MAG: NADP-dependent oxidoreductase [Microbacteriaceae bacterium]|nr:NADP-dependent oxidoreductase [Microbacteriaceae bacterium]